MAETAPADLWFIRDPQALAELCLRLATAREIAFDTEFERSRTYFAELCLIQVAADGVLACIDPLALPDLAPLFEVLGAAPARKLAHASRQDLEVLYQRGGSLPAPLFDTQVAAALCGHPEQIGYGDLVRELLGVALGKTATRTDWRQRPLSAEQLAYAADDVRYLAPLAASLEARLDRLGRREWLVEDCRALANPALYDPPVGSAWQRIKSITGLPPAARGRAAALASWREETARTRNLPRNWVIKDAALIELALRPPAALHELADGNYLDAGSVRRYGAAILTALQQAPERLPEQRERLTQAGRDLLKQLTAALHERARELALNPATLATRSELEALICGRPSARLTSGWRPSALGATLIVAAAPGVALCE